MKYTQFNGKYYVKEKLNTGAILLTPTIGMYKVKAWAREVMLNYDLSEVKFIKADNKVICLAEANSDMCGASWGMASCRQEGGTWGDDEFDFEVGKAISFYRAMGYILPDFVCYDDGESKDECW